MSLLSAIGGLASRALPAISRFMGGGGAVRTMTRAAGGRVLPAIGRTAAGVGLGTAGAAGIAGLFGGDDETARRRRRRGRGFSARDIRQTRRMLKLLKEMQSAIPRARAAPRHHHHS